MAKRLSICLRDSKHRLTSVKRHWTRRFQIRGQAMRPPVSVNCLSDSGIHAHLSVCFTTDGKLLFASCCSAVSEPFLLLMCESCSLLLLSLGASFGSYKPRTFHMLQLTHCPAMIISVLDKG